MGDMGEIFNGMKESTRKHRAEMLEKANTAGWKRHDAYHFSRKFGGKTLHWWPSGGKAMWNGGTMIYGHRKVNALILGLVAGEARSIKG